MKCVATSPIAGPPRAWRSAARSMPAIVALRTFGSSNGGLVVLNAT